MSEVIRQGLDKIPYQVQATKMYICIGGVPRNSVVVCIVCTPLTPCFVSRFLFFILLYGNISKRGAPGTRIAAWL